jgi:hypothetical protein
MYAKTFKHILLKLLAISNAPKTNMALICKKHKEKIGIQKLPIVTLLVTFIVICENLQL